jgi:hypothetical protein
MALSSTVDLFELISLLPRKLTTLLLDSTRGKGSLLVSCPTGVRFGLTEQTTTTEAVNMADTVGTEMTDDLTAVVVETGTMTGTGRGQCFLSR